MFHQKQNNIRLKDLCPQRECEAGCLIKSDGILRHGTAQFICLPIAVDSPKSRTLSELPFNSGVPNHWAMDRYRVLDY